MKQSFQNALDNTPDVTFYHGAIVHDFGEWKLEWNDPQEGVSLLTETDLLQKEEESRMKLDPNGDRNEWIRQRNINYSAEYGLAKLQAFKMNLGAPLQERHRPV